MRPVKLANLGPRLFAGVGPRPFGAVGRHAA
jgi:hypothetical protein